jgi:hypothetical protein
MLSQGPAGLLFLALPPAAHERGPASGRPGLDAAGAKYNGRGGGRPAGEQFDVVSAEPAAFVQVGNQAYGERVRVWEAFPYRPGQADHGDAVPVQDLADLGVGVQGGDQLDFRGSAR